MPKTNYLHDDITALIWPEYRRLFVEFKARPGFNEREKANALYKALKSKNISVSREVPVILRNGSRIGHGFIDLVVDCRVAVEIKNLVKGVPEIEVEEFKRNMEGMGLAVGVVLNFSAADVNSGYQRVYLRHNDPYIGDHHVTPRG